MATNSSSSHSTSIPTLPVADALSMDVLLKWKVADLRVELSKHGLSGKGTKPELIKRLQGLSKQDLCSSKQGTRVDSVNPANLTQLSEVINYKCGVTSDDGRPLVECSNCLEWSHLHCYGLSSSSAKTSDFLCCICLRKSILSGSNAIQTIDEDLRKLSDSILLLKDSLAKQVRICNVQFLAMKEEISSLSQGAKYSSRDIVTVLDHLNVLDQQVEDLSFRVGNLSSSSRNERSSSCIVDNHVLPSSDSSQRQVRHSRRVSIAHHPYSIRSSPKPNPWIPPVHLLASPSAVGPFHSFRLQGADISNSASVIGRLILGFYNYTNVPNFSVSFDCMLDLLPIFVIDIPVKDVDLFFLLWSTGVRQDVSFVLIDPPPSLSGSVGKCPESVMTTVSGSHLSSLLSPRLPVSDTPLVVVPRDSTPIVGPDDLSIGLVSGNSFNSSMVTLQPSVSVFDPEDVIDSRVIDVTPSAHSTSTSFLDNPPLPIHLRPSYLSPRVGQLAN